MTKLPVEYAHWDDMVFEGREKSYGAYELRQRYPRHLVIGLIAVALLGGTLTARKSMAGNALSSVADDEMNTGWFVVSAIICIELQL